MRAPAARLKSVAPGRRDYGRGPRWAGMREAESTTRERIRERLREESAALGTLANEFDVTTAVAADHVEHLARSLEHEDEQLLVAPPECERCGFDDFDDPVNRPSRCPQCKHEHVHEPVFRVD